MNLIFIHSSKYDSFCCFNSFLVNLHAPNSYIAQRTPCLWSMSWFPSIFQQLAGKFLNTEKEGPFSIQPKIREILVGISNGTDSFGLLWLAYSGPALKVVLFDRSGHFSQLDWNVPFLVTKLLSPILLFCFLLTRTITEHAEK